MEKNAKKESDITIYIGSRDACGRETYVVLWPEYESFTITIKENLLLS